MYTMLGDKSDAQTAIAEIQMIKKAAHEYKYAPGKDNRYGGATMATLKSYLGQSGLASGQNIFGTLITAGPVSGERDLAIKYPGVRSLDICRQILNQFGEVVYTPEEVAEDGDVDSAAFAHINAGKTISGFVGGNNPATTGCRQTNGGAYILNVRID